MGILDHFHRTSNHEGSSIIQAIYILKGEGVPVFSRYFTDYIPDSSEIVLLSGFLMAIHGFAKNTLHTKITDLGVEDKRLYFYEVNDLVYVIISHEDFEGKKIDAKEEMFTVLETIAMAFSLITQNIDIDNEEEMNEMISSFGATCDNIVFEFTYKILESALQETSNELQDFLEDDEYLNLATELGQDVSLVFTENEEEDFQTLFQRLYNEINEENE